MEYIGGRSLKQMLAVRRAANGGDPDPLPVDQAIAFVLAILPAFTYLHGRGLLYCDFKPDNLIQVGDEVRLIDLGAVRRFDDHTSAVYGTVGFQAPEIADMGPSVASDVYTIGRTLAVLTLDFRGYQSKLQHALPDPADHPVLARFDSFHRLLLKATAAHPDDRFQTVAELGEQMLGVLREHVALTTGRPQAVPSGVFGPVPDDDTGLAALPPAGRRRLRPGRRLPGQRGRGIARGGRARHRHRRRPGPGAGHGRGPAAAGPGPASTWATTPRPRPSSTGWRRTTRGSGGRCGCGA